MLVTSKVKTSTLAESIVAWLIEHAPDWLDTPEPGASADDIAQLEAQLGRRLPTALRDLLLVTNGGLYIGEYATLSVEKIGRRWSAFKRFLEEGRFDTCKPYPDRRELIKKAWWHPGYLPFAQDSCGNLICLDLDPGPKGTVGQIVWWETNAGPIADSDGTPSLKAFLQTYWDNLAAGAYDESEVWDEANARTLTH